MENETPTKLERLKNVWNCKHKEPFYTRRNLKFLWYWIKNIFLGIRCSNVFCFRKATKFLRAIIKGTDSETKMGYCDKCAEKVHKEMMSGNLYNNYDEDSYKK